ncbi:uncharacterized protein LOC135336231 [Halichondria panicea]|uniref:uncharacterized protein LOC135336231 n=1 Tax=Halichondria panicea TaxID=6063 RepID=UPI00312B48BA
MATPSNYCVKDVAMLTEPEIETRAASDAPFFKIGVEVKGEEYLCYVSSDNNGLMCPPKTDNCKSPSVVMNMVKLEKQGDSDQHGYVITNPVVKDTYLKVITDETLGSRAVRFDKKSGEVFYQSQLFKLRKNTSSDSETKFALYTTAINSKGNSVIYYLKPESGTIVAEESSSPDNYDCFWFGRRNINFEKRPTYGPSLTASELTQLLQSSPTVQVVIQIASSEFFLKTDTRNDTLFDSSTVLNNTLPIPLSCILTFTSPTVRVTQPRTFTCTSQVLNLHHLNTTNAAVLFQEVHPPTFQFEEAPSRSPYDMIIYEPGASPVGGNNFLTLVNNPQENPLKNVTATTEKRLATWFVVYQVLA